MTRRILRVIANVVWNVESVNGRVHRQYCRSLLQLSLRKLPTGHQQAWLASGSIGEGCIILALGLDAIVHGCVKSICIRSVHSRVAPSCTSIWISSSLAKQYRSTLLMMCSFFVMTCANRPVNCKQIRVYFLLSAILISRTWDEGIEMVSRRYVDYTIIHYLSAGHGRIIHRIAWGLSQILA